MLQQDLLLAVPESVRYERRPLADGDNAYECWAQAIAAYHEPTFPPLWFERLERNPDEDWPTPLEPAERETMRAWVESSQQAIDLCEEGAARGKFHWPIFAEHWSERENLFPAIQLRSLAHLRCARARLAADDGASPLAADELLQTLRFLDLLMRGEGGWIECTLAMATIRHTIDSLRHLVGQFDLPAATRRELIDALRTLPAFEPCMQLAISVELCTERLLDLNRLPDEASLPELVEALLRFYYSPLTTLDLTSELCNEPLLDREVATRRLEQRRRQLLLLLGDHPRPFEKLATARLMGECAVSQLQDFSAETPPPTPTWFARRILEFKAIWASNSAHQLARAWPAMLTPDFPLEMFGDDPAAEQQRIATRLGVTGLAGWRLSRDLRPLTDKRLKRQARQLRGLDNPVGRMISQRSIQMHAIRNSTAECTASVTAAIAGLNGGWRTRTAYLRLAPADQP